MATAAASVPRRSAPVVRGRGRGIWAVVGLIVIVLVVWEGVKFIGGTPWRSPGFIPGTAVIWNPPFRFPSRATSTCRTSGTSGSSSSSRGSAARIATSPSSCSTPRSTPGRRRSSGSRLGTLIGLALATAFVHSRWLERSFVPFVVASQTIPIIALSPLIVFALGAKNVASIVVIATYLTFFPVTIAMIRGLRSFDPRAMELMRSYAASRSQIYWKLRLPASLPFLFVALKIAATASIVGAIIGESTGGINDGLGLVILTFNQYYITGPEKLWAAIIASGLLGITFYVLVSIVEHFVLRGRTRQSLD